MTVPSANTQFRQPEISAEEVPPTPLEHPPSQRVRALPRRAAFAIGAVLIVSGALFSYVQWGRPEPFPEGLIQANGRMEGDHVTIASKFAGRIAELRAYEGDEVAADSIVVRIDDKQAQAQVEQAKESVAACDARINAAEAKIVAATAKVKAAETSLSVLRKEVPLTIESAEAHLQLARAAVASAESSERRAKTNVERHRKLAKEKATSQSALEDYELAWTVTQSDLITANAVVVKAQKSHAESELGFDRIKAKEDELKAFQADVEEARASRDECIASRAEAQAALAEVQSVLDDLTILAPSSGVITTRMADEGEVVAPGTPLFDLVDLNRLYLKVYIPENQIGKVRLHLKARIHTDAFPDRPFEATVRYISSRAEFTPKEVQTPDERVKLVYAVRLYLDENPDHCLTPGLPADAVIRWKDDVPWAKPRW